MDKGKRRKESIYAPVHAYGTNKRHSCRKQFVERERGSLKIYEATGKERIHTCRVRVGRVGSIRDAVARGQKVREKPGWRVRKNPWNFVQPPIPSILAH